jgi:hypothetical protein
MSDDRCLFYKTLVPGISLWDFGFLFFEFFRVWEALKRLAELEQSERGGKKTGWLLTASQPR